MGICTDHHASGECVVFKNHLVDDACTGLPESDAIFGRYGFKKIIHLLVLDFSRSKVGLNSYLRLDEVVAMNSGRNGSTVAAGCHELQQGHLSSGILHGYAVWLKIDIIDSARMGFRRICFEQMTVQDLFCQG